MPGPRAGRFPTDPFLATFPVVNRALLDQMFPEGSVQKNTGTIRWDDPSRRSPYTHQYSVGAERQLRSDHVRERRLLAQGAAGPAGAGRPQSAASPRHDAERHKSTVRSCRSSCLASSRHSTWAGRTSIRWACRSTSGTATATRSGRPTPGRTAGATSRTTTSRARSSCSTT